MRDNDIYKLIVSHSHSCGPARWLPGPAKGRCVALLPAKPPARFRLLELGCIADRPCAELEPRGRVIDIAASFELVVLSGLSISMPVLESACSTATLLLCRRCRFEEEDAADVRGKEAAPGPGRFLIGAAAMGITPLPPAIMVDEPP